MRAHRDPALTYPQRLWTALVLCVLALCTLACQASCGASISRLSSVPLVDPVIYGEYAHTVKIVAMCPDGSMFGGSGVRVDDDSVLTAGHVVTCDGVPAPMVAVVDRSGKVHPAKIEAISIHDIARLSVPVGGVTGLPHIAPVAVAAAEIGERACATFEIPELGRRCGEVWPSRPERSADLIVDFVAEHGNSGAPLWDPRGRLIGIVVTLRYCPGTGIPQVCTAGAVSLGSRAWLAAP